MPFGISAAGWGAIAAGTAAVGSVASGLIGSSAASSAADTAAGASDRAAQLTQERYQQTRNDLLPYNATGQAAQNKLGAIFGLGGQARAGGGLTVAAPAVTQQTAQTATPGQPGGGGTLPDGWRILAANAERGPLLMDPNDQIRSSLNAGGGTPEAEAAQFFADNGIATPLTQPPVQQQALGPEIPLETAGGQRALVGALPGADSAVNPYAAPNGGVFAPIGGTQFTGNPLFAGQPNFQLTPEQLAQTPGYQFALEQGLRATANSATARGLGVSGAALKGASKFATGLADNTYMNQAAVFGQNYQREATQFGDNYNRMNTQFGDNYNRQNNLFATNLNASTGLNKQYYDYNINPLLELTKIGGSAAAQSGLYGTSSGNTQAGLINSSGVVQANAGLAGAATLQSGIKGAAGAGYNYLMDSARPAAAGPAAAGPAAAGPFWPGV